MNKENIIRCLKPIEIWAKTFLWVKNGYYPSKFTLNEIILGKLGEVIISYELFGEDRVNWDITPGKGDGGIDLEIPDQKITIDVKTTQYWKYPELKENVGVPTPIPNLYALVAINPDNWDYEICGWMPGPIFISDEYYVENYRDKGERYIASTRKGQLFSLEEAIRQYKDYKKQAGLETENENTHNMNKGQPSKTVRW